MKILVVGPAWIGDMVMAQSLFIRLRERHPDARVEVVAPAWSAPVLARMPEVARHHPLPVGHGALGLGARIRLGYALRKEGFDQAIIIPRSWKSALVPFVGGIPRRTGYLGEMRYGILNDIRPLDEMLLPRTVDRYVALASDADEPFVRPRVTNPRLTVDHANQQRLFAAFSLSTTQPAIGFVPGAEYGPAKRWPPEHFAELARLLGERGREVWLFGSMKDRAICQEIVERAGEGVIDLSGRTDLGDAIDLIAATERMVSNDSGLMHVAAAVGTPVVGLYGSSSPGNTPPLSPDAVILSLGLECSPCYKRECPFGHYRCLTGIDVGLVLNAMRIQEVTT
jgi:heptosyltransferase-2